MAFLDLLFPDTIALGMVSGPRFATTIAPSPSGDEALMEHWPVELGAWTLEQRNRTEAETITLIALHRIACGRAHGFKLHDPTDDMGFAELLGTGDGVEADFQLRKYYAEDLLTYVRPIYKPFGTVLTFFNGTPNVAFTVDDDTGIVTFAPVPGIGVVVTASFTFYIPVRFDVDQCMITIVEPGVYTWGGIRLVELNAASGI